MGKLYFVLGFHNHQPVGNFDSVFEWAHKDCYHPLLATLEKFPKIKFAIHTSGPLYDWLIKNDKEYIAILKRLVKRGQAEIVGGAYYEPILPLICDKDKSYQIKKMNDFVSDEFKTRVRGMWLAERVWEPGLASVMHDSGIEYTFLDDTHFRYGGIDCEDFLGYYTTEDQGKPLQVFPISKPLRYKMPFATAQEGIDLLNRFVGGQDTLITFFDDGEKFGLWPNTYDWVFNRHWLETFLQYLSDSVTVETIHPSEAVDRFASNGLAYLPTASYEEMGEWVLTPSVSSHYEQLNKFLKDSHRYEQFKGFIRGGFFRNFQRKYPRLNYMHNSMLHVSQTIHAKTTPVRDEKIFTDLWKAQTNCGYWHGVFGGFYMGHIRGAVYENLIKAQNSFDKKYNKEDIVLEQSDIDLDGHCEVIVRNKAFIAVFSRVGGAMLELSLRNPAINLSNTLTRQEEQYHAKITARAEGKSDGVESIHDRVAFKDNDLGGYMTIDGYERLSIVDHLLDKSIGKDSFNNQQGVDSLSQKVYDLTVKQLEKKVLLKYQYRSQNLMFAKNITIENKAGFKVAYDFEYNDALREKDFGIEFNLFLPSIGHVVTKASGEEIPLSEPREFNAQDNFTIYDNLNHLAFDFCCNGASVITMPVYSVSSSEFGFEKTYQQLAVLFIVKNRPKNFVLGVEIKK